MGHKCKILSINIKNNIEERCEKLGMSLNSSLIKKNDILERTKGELKERRCNYQSYRSSIRKNAYEMFFNNCSDKKCAICGYDKHVEIAHIKPVSEFDDNTLISEINSIDNLIALCPNHHWEFDHGILKI